MRLCAAEHKKPRKKELVWKEIMRQGISSTYNLYYTTVVITYAEQSVKQQENTVPPEANI
jgi:hypothetical protein